MARTCSVGPRLLGATGAVGYNQPFRYDIYGNVGCAASRGEPKCLAPTYSTSNNNQINYVTTAGVNTYYQYDLAGNLQNGGANTYQWDAEGHLAAVYLNANGSLVSMNTYNALGQRVEDVTQGSTTDEAYGAGGALLARYSGDSNSRSFVPFGGGLLAEYYCGGMIFDHPDEIGSATTATDCTGNNIQERLYYPYGEFWTGANPDNLGMHQEFAKLPDYDPEIDEYNTANRYYSPMGRWMSPDPGGVKVVRLDDPQTWNMYAYARNNPTTVTDPSGLMPPGSIVEENGGSDTNARDNMLPELCQNGNQNSPCTDQEKTAPDTTPQEAPTFTLALGGVTVSGTFSGAEFSNGQKGADINANPQDGTCDGCRWTQTVARTGQGAFAETTDGKTGSPLYPGGYHTGGNDGANLFDQPKSTNVGTFKAVSSLVVADEKNKTVKVIGSMTWGYKIDGNGKVSPTAPRVATHAEQTLSIEVLKRENPAWTISP